MGSDGGGQKFRRRGSVELGEIMDEKKKIILRDLPGWPPEPGGAYESGTEFPRPWEAVIIEVIPVDATSVTFKAQYKKYSHSYHFFAASKEIASQIQIIVGANIGKSVASLAEFEIEA